MKREKTPKIRILLVDDHPVVLEGIRSCLAKDKHIEIIGEASDGEEAIQKAKALHPDVVLMDISLRGMTGLDATRLLSEAVPGAKVLALTVHSDRQYVREMLQSGARGYILKDASPSELIHAIESVNSGHAFFCPGISQVVLNDYAQEVREADRSRTPELSKREQEVLVLIADGHSNREIAEQLGVSSRTVETHRERIMRKLDIHNVAELTKFAIAKGIVKLE